MGKDARNPLVMTFRLMFPWLKSDTRRMNGDPLGRKGKEQRKR